MYSHFDFDVVKTLHFLWFFPSSLEGFPFMLVSVSLLLLPEKLPKIIPLLSCEKCNPLLFRKGPLQPFYDIYSFNEFFSSLKKES